METDTFLSEETAEAVVSEAEQTPPTYPEYTLPPVLEAPSYLPQGLVDLVVQAVELNTLDDTLTPLETGRSVSDEELLSIMEREDQPEDFWGRLSSYVDSEPALFEGHIVIEVDGDNDGILDLIVITTGGSAGNTSLMFFQGQTGGRYQNTYDAISFLGRGTYGFLSFDEKEYFWSSNSDYATKGTNGLNIYEFQNGVPVEYISIYSEVVGYEVDTQQGKNAYTDKLTPMVTELWEDGFPQFAGTAERAVEDQVHYWGDLDNDGEEEFYFKNTWFPTTFWDVVRLHFQYEDGDTGPVDELLKIMGEHNYAVQTLWCDKEEQGNIIYTISRSASHVLSADAWQYREAVWEHLAQVLYEPQYTVKIKTYTQDLNIDFLDTKAFM